MIKISVKTNTTRKEIIKELTATPEEVLNEVGADTQKGAAILDGVSLNSAKMKQTFAELGIADNATVTLSSIVKADSAR